MQRAHRPEPLHDLEVVGLDWESYFESTQGYSLKSRAYTTSTYVRSELFQPLCLSLRRERWRKAKSYRGDKAEQALAQIDWSRTALLCHHTHFDGLILSHHYGITPRYYLDTLGMARALHGNHIGNSLDEVAPYYGRGNKLPDVLLQCEGLRREEIPRDLMKALMEYNNNDVDIMWNVFWDMITNGFPDEELDINDLTISLFTEPVLEVDRDLATAERDREREERKKLFRRVAKLTAKDTEIRDLIQSHKGRMATGKKPRKTDLFTIEENMAKQLNSNETYAEMLRQAGVHPPMKTSPSDPEKHIYAFAKNDLDFQTLQAHPKRTIRELVEARLKAKSNIAEERAVKLLERSENGMRMPVYLLYCGAHTMRWSGGDGINPQNFPVEGRKGQKSKIRRCLVAPRGMAIVVVDSSQIEARENAWFAGEKNLLEALADKYRDPYSEFAEKLFNKRVTKEDPERDVGKVCILGLGYGMGWKKLQVTLATGSMGPPVFLSEEMCRRAVDLFRGENQYIQLMWKQLGKLIASCLYGGQELILHDLLHFRKEEILMPNGLSLHYPNLRLVQGETEWETNFFYRSRQNEKSKIYGGLLDENIIQCLSRITIGPQALRIAEKYRIISLSHDEVIYLAPERRAQTALDDGLEALSTPPEWAPDLPLAAEGGYAKEYSK